MIARLVSYSTDLAIWEPVIRVALIVGGFTLLLESEMEIKRKGKTTQSAAILMFDDSLDLTGSKGRNDNLFKMSRWIIPLIMFIFLTSAMLWQCLLCCHIFPIYSQISVIDK